MPPINIILGGRAVIAMAADVLPVDTSSGEPSGPAGTAVVVIFIAPFVFVGLIAVGVIYRTQCRRPSNRLRLDDEQNLGEEPIPLQDLPLPESLETIEEAGSHPSTPRGVRPFTLNEFNIGLASNPPSQADLATAEQALNSRTDINKLDSDVNEGRATILNASNVEIPPLPPAGPGIQTMPEILDEHNQQQPQTPKFCPPSTIAEESSEGDIKRTSIISQQDPHGDDSKSPEASNDEGDIGTKHVDKPAFPAHEEEPGSEPDTDEEPVPQTASLGVRYKGGVQTSHSNWSYSYEDEEYDPNDPRYDVRGAIVRYGNARGFQSKTSKAEKTTQIPSNNNDGSDDNLNPLINREFSNKSMVPEPLKTSGVRKNNSIHEPSSPTIASSSGTQPGLGPRPASAADVDTMPSERPERPERPVSGRSFKIQGWPPRNIQNPTFEQAGEQNNMWYKRPSDDIIEASRIASEQREWEQTTRNQVLKEAQDAGETLSDEEIDRRVRRLYERSSLFTLPSTTYQPRTPPARPNSVVIASSPCRGRGRARAHHRSRSSFHGPLSPRMHDNIPPIREEPAFASSQVLPLAASMASVTAQDGSRSGSPPAIPPRAPDRGHRHSFQGHENSYPEFI